MFPGNMELNNEFRGFAMMQFWVDGLPMFMHANWIKYVPAGTVIQYYATLERNNFRVDAGLKFDRDLGINLLNDTWPEIFDRQGIAALAI
jgi:hypothetical protein